MPRKTSFKNLRKNNDIKHYGNSNLTEIDLETEYVNSTLSVKQLSAKYEIPYNQLKALSRVNEWGTKKRDKAISTAIKVNDIVCDDIVSFKVKLIKRNYEQLAKTQDLIGLSIDKMLKKNKHNLQELLCLTKILKNVNDICIGNDVGEHSAENVTLDKLDKLITNIKEMD